MSVPNIGPEHPEDAHTEAQRRGNPALVFRDDPVSGDVAAASTRATAVSSRFGGVRYALTRRIHAERPWDFSTGGESDESQ
jgi:hypothetical protein